jgi:hypothetical protein
MTNEWGHLPNAHYIDCILSSLRSKPKMWKEIYMADEELWDRPRFHSAWHTADNIVRSSNRYQAWLEVLYGVGNEGAGTGAGYGSILSRGAILALIAYDDAGQYLEWDPEKLEVISILTESPTQFLMLPAVRALNQQLAHG